MKRASFVLVGLLACGGATIEPIDDGGGKDSSPGNDAGTYCPSSPPAQGSACSKNGLWCEWGNDPNMNCNTTAQCANGSWIIQPGADCLTPPNPSTCPATFASVPVGQSCGSLVGTTCQYEKGMCGCAVPSGGPYPEDAAAAAKWFCDDPAAGCPMPRPKLGTSCNSEGLQCDYSPCTLPTGASIVCQGGAWENQPYGCAL